MFDLRLLMGNFGNIFKIKKSCQLTLDIVLINAKNEINVLGMIFDSKLSWDHQVSRAKREQIAHCKRFNKLNDFLQLQRLFKF